MPTDQTPQHVELKLAVRGRNQADRLLARLLCDRQQTEQRLEASGKQDALKRLTGASSLDRAIESTRVLLRSVDELVEELCGGLAGSVNGAAAGTGSPAVNGTAAANGTVPTSSTTKANGTAPTSVTTKANGTAPANDTAVANGTAPANDTAVANGTAPADDTAVANGTASNGENGAHAANDCEIVVTVGAPRIKAGAAP